MMVSELEYGEPSNKIRIEQIESRKRTSNSTYDLVAPNFKKLQLARIEVPIGFLVYRTDNIRTKSLQREWLHSNPNSSFKSFKEDSCSLEVQKVQHELLKTLIVKENLKKNFEDPKNKQDMPLIVTYDGIVLNGNRRLCAWRELYYSNKEKYSHFKEIDVAILRYMEPHELYELEAALQIRKDMKAEYVWHAIAYDCYERYENGEKYKDIGLVQGKNEKDVERLIESYKCASEYLKSINHEDEWSLVDEKYSAFDQFAKSRDKIKDPEDKKLFKDISYALLQVPAKGGRLYAEIPEVQKHIKEIGDHFVRQFEIETPDIPIGIEGDSVSNSAFVSREIRRKNIKPEEIVKTVKGCLDILEDGKKAEMVLAYVSKADTYLQQALQVMEDYSEKDGISKHLVNIQKACEVLSEWVKND